MRDSISANLKYWENCTMWVQDLIPPYLNITAEITDQEVGNFVRMCQLFADYSPKCYDDCSMTTPNATCNVRLPLQNLKQDADFMSLIQREISNSRLPSVLETRKRFELEITSMLARCVQKFDSSFKLYSFGSTQYDVRIANANFNVLISTSKFISPIESFL